MRVGLASSKNDQQKQPTYKQSHTRFQSHANNVMLAYRNTPSLTLLQAPFTSNCHAPHSHHMSKKTTQNVLVAFYNEDPDSNTSHMQQMKPDNSQDDSVLEEQRDTSQIVVSEVSGCPKKREFSASQRSSMSQEDRQRKIKKLQDKLSRLKQGDGFDDSSEEQYSMQHYRNKLFSCLPKKNQTIEHSKAVIDVDAQTDFQSNSQRSGSHSDLLNIQLIKREIKREQKLDIQRMKKEKQDMRELLQLQPRRKHTKKLQKRQKVVSKRTLQLLAKKFDEYYAYQNNMEYKGPKISLREIGQIFDIGANTIHKLYTEWMDDPTFYDRIIRYDLHKRVPERKLTLERLEHVARLIKENPFLTQNELCVQLNKIEDLKSIKEGKRQEINKTTVARLLKVGKFKKKRVRCVPKERNTSKQLERRYEFCAKYKELVDRKAKIYFLDESGFNLYMTREKAWSRPNEEITVNCPISKGKRFSLIAIIGEEGLANWRIIEGTYRKYEYLEFIRELFEKLYDLREEDSREKWLIMDNCAIHDKEETLRLAEKWEVRVMYLPAYSPQLNPIEMWFHEVKTKIRKTNYSGEKQLLDVMKHTLTEYEDHDFSSYYHGSIKFVEKGLRREKF